jgi:hypothetical protein
MPQRTNGRGWAQVTLAEDCLRSLGGFNVRADVILVKSAQQARRMAEAFGVKVPYAKEPLESKKCSAGAPAIKF